MKRNLLKQLNARVPKYRAAPTVIDSIRFASKKEAHRYKELKVLQRAGLISALRCQVTFSLDIKGFHICNYIADFSYWDNQKDERVIEDVKGFVTQPYRIKKKLMLAILGIQIKET